MQLFLYFPLLRYLKTFFLSFLSLFSFVKLPSRNSWRRPGGSVCLSEGRGSAQERRRDVLCSQRVFLSFFGILLAPQLRARARDVPFWSPRRWLRYDLQAGVLLSQNPFFYYFFYRFQSPAHTHWSLVSSNYCVMGSSGGLASVFSWLYSSEKPFMFLLSRCCMPSIIFLNLSPSVLGPSIVLDWNYVIM